MSIPIAPHGAIAIASDIMSFLACGASLCYRWIGHLNAPCWGKDRTLSLQGIQIGSSHRKGIFFVTSIMPVHDF